MNAMLLKLLGASVRPSFQVKKLEGTFQRRVVTRTKAGFEYKFVEQERGYMVFFPNGHSIHVVNDAELARLGYDKSAPLVDTESGEMLPINPDELTLEELSSRRTRSSRSDFQNAAA